MSTSPPFQQQQQQQQCREGQRRQHPCWMVVRRNERVMVRLFSFVFILAVVVMVVVVERHDVHAFSNGIQRVRYQQATPAAPSSPLTTAIPIKSAIIHKSRISSSLYERKERNADIPSSTNNSNSNSLIHGTTSGSSITPTRTKRHKKRRKKKKKQSNSKKNTNVDDPHHHHDDHGSTTASTPVTATTTAVVATSILSSSSSSSKHGKKYSKNASGILQETSLTEGDLANHVANSYIHGPGGFFSESDAKRQRLEEETHVYRTDPSHVQQLEYLRQLDRHPSLVLNADYQPLSILPLSLWSWQETVKAVFSGKVQVVEVYPNLNIRAVNMDVALPSVIALTDFVKQPHQIPAFTRRNVYLRDGYICQYCGNRFRTPDLTLDHVHPRCHGGKLDWNNAVTCCKKCNAKKGSTLPSELRGIGMKLLKEPRVPSKYELASVAGQMYPRRGVHPTWEPYLGVGMKPKKGDYGREDGGGGFEEEDELEFEF